MSILNRISTLLKSNINDLISQAEDPQKILTQLIIDMKKQLIDAKKQVAVAIADEKRLKKQVSSEQKLALEWRNKAMNAVKKGRDDLAKPALGRHQEHLANAQGLDEQWTLQKNAADSLKASLHQLSNKIGEAERKKGLLIARARRAEAQKKIQETMHGLSESSAFDAFDRMAEKVDQLEAEAEATTELGEEMSGDSLAAELDALDDGGSDDALAALKAEMAGASAGALPPAQPAATGLSDLEAELSDLKSKVAAESPGT